MFSKRFILLLINICLCSSELTISPSNDIKINEGEKLEISCTASEAVDFIYPKHIEGVITRSTAETSDERVNGLAKFILKRANLVFGDSGWYGCVEKSKNQPEPSFGSLDVTPYNYDKTDVKWIYVTVNSTQHLLHDIPFLSKNANGEYVLLKKEDDDVILPCRLTSADYSVKLYNSIDNTPIDSFEYDPKKGITLKKIKKDSILQYNCHAEKKDGTKSEPKKFKIEIIDFSENPVITSNVLSFMEIGRNFSMECTSLVSKYESYVLDWTVPQTDRIIKTVRPNSNLTVGNEKLSYHRVNLQLTIINVVKEDFGNYECRLYKYASVETAKINLTPHEQKHVEISLKGSNSVVIESGAPYTWILDINAYPLPELHWVHPQGNSIPLQAKFRSFQVNDEKFSLDFTKTQFTIDDLGTHTIVAKSSDIQKTVTFKVLAHTSPKVMEVKQNEACLAKEATIFECQAKGYPVPEITWNCVDDKGVIENDAEFMVLKTDPKEFEVSSVVEVKKCPQRSVVCKAHNKNGDNSMTKQISNQAPAQGTDQSGSDGCPLVEKPKKNENVNPPGGDLSQKKTEVLPKIVEIEPIKKRYKLFETVKLSCQASGEPRPTITWEYWNHHNELVQNIKNTSEDPKATSDETLVKSVATIQIVTPGHVKCKAENKLGKDSKVEKIDIEASQIEGQHSSGQPPAATIPVTGGKGPTNSVVEATTKKAEASQIEGQHSSGQPPAATIPVTGGKGPTNSVVEATTKKAEASQIEGQHSSGQPPAATIPVTGGKGPTNSVVEATTKKAEASQIEGQHSSGQPPAATIPVTGGKGPTNSVVEATTKKAEVPKVQGQLPAANTSVPVGKAPTNPGVEATTKKAETSGPVSEKPDSKNKPASTEQAKPKAKPEDVDPFSLGTDDQKINATKGDTVTMHCNASTSIFGDDIKWYNTSNVLATSGKVEIKETKETPLHSSHLTIKDIQLWDKGDYSCEGTKRDGSAVRKIYHVHVNASAVFSASVILQLSIILLAYFM